MSKMRLASICSSGTEQTEKLIIGSDGSTRWEQSEAAKPAKISPYLDPVLVTPGTYLATYVGHAGITTYRSNKVLVMFRLVEHAEITLPRYYRVRCYHPRVEAPASSDIVREMGAALGQRVRRDRIPVPSLAGIIVRVRVRTVVRDRNQRELAEVNTYSVIEEVLGGT